MGCTTSSPSRPVALILGTSSRIESSIATKLSAEGYKVALGRRSREEITPQSDANITPVIVDISEPKSTIAAFIRVKRDLGIPKVVVYNASSLWFPSDLSDPVGSITAETMENGFCVNALGGYAVIRETMEAFRALREAAGDNSISSNGVFITIPNAIPEQPLPEALSLDLAKTLVLMQRVVNEAHNSDGLRFYFPTQVTETGRPAPRSQINVETHVRVYWDLIQRSSQGHWDVRFLADGTEVERTY